MIHENHMYNAAMYVFTFPKLQQQLPLPIRMLVVSMVVVARALLVLYKQTLGVFLASQQ